MSSRNERALTGLQDRPAPAAPVHLTRAERVGLPSGMAWGILAVIVFVVGDGLEVAWISQFFTTAVHIPLSEAAWIVTAFGIVVGVTSYAVGPLCARFGPRRVMAAGLIFWVIIDAAFIGLALPTGNYWFILITYALRGTGTPLYVFAFLVWLDARAKAGQEAGTQAWFWFAYTAGQIIFGNVLAGYLVPTLGPIATLWIGLGVALAGGLIGVLLVRDSTGQGTQRTSENLGKAFEEALTIIWRQPKVGMGGLVKLINLGGIIAMGVYYVPYITGVIHLPLGLAILSFTFLGIAAVPAMLFFGWLSDRIGWANTVQWIAAPISAIAMVALFLVPQWVGPNFLVIVLLMILLGLGNAAFVPISALVPSIASNEKVAGLGVINLSTGMAALLGPAAVAVILPSFGFAGVAWGLGIAYVVAFALMFYVQLPGRARTDAHVTSTLVAVVRPDATVNTGSK
ncbi:sugar phosphate permease [Arthrobacter sp. SLBN-100]|uniref:MFS transporter n=1 Tax=Arthrobacter sp. SLBN-100 TaxID=2768450 RepID=UPI001151576C|nr:MFS transporter [Arthrobacter sp. SLBN-100]TQJ62066.1 sugar phosphate permease [Arthrobacter sp. SLBN-100]